jgi:hypothetical protein
MLTAMFARRSHLPYLVGAAILLLAAGIAAALLLP